MAIYTRTGDQGTTGLLGGERTGKGSWQIGVLGCLDELNSHLGLAVAVCESYLQTWKGLDRMRRAVAEGQMKAGGIFKKQERIVEDLGLVIERLQVVQGELFGMGAELAQSHESMKSRDQGSDGRSDKLDTAELEQWIDEAEVGVPELKNFILPGGGVAGAELMVARSVCRRAERELVRYINQKSKVSAKGRLASGQKSQKSRDRSWKFEPSEGDAMMLAYLNRLSDWLFVVSRRVNWVMGEEEVVWRG